MPRLFFCLISILLASNLYASPEEFETSERIVAVGDLHGDLDSFQVILRGAGLADKDGNWIGKRTILIQLGDVIDRGPQSKELMDYLIVLEKQAELAGGRVIALIGNHDVRVLEGKLSHLHLHDHILFSRMYEDEDDLDVHPMTRALQNAEPYASWLRKRPAIVQINDNIFVHAGIEEWGLKKSINQINNEVHEYVTLLQRGVRLPERLMWLDRKGGPFRTRQFKGLRGDGDEEDLEWLLSLALARWNARRLVVGHITTKPRLLAPHPNIGNKMVYMMDTGISRAIGGELTALEIGPAGPRVLRFPRPPTQWFSTLKTTCRVLLAL